MTVTNSIAPTPFAAQSIKRSYNIFLSQTLTIDVKTVLDGRVPAETIETFVLAR